MRSIATTNQTTNDRSNGNNIAAPATPAKPQTAKEVIAANVKLLIEQLEAGHSEGLTAYLAAMGKFHNYSLGNILRSHGRSRTPPALQGCMHGISLDAR